VIGVLAGSLNEGGGIGWAIPSKYVLELLGGSVLGKTAEE